MTEPFEDLPDDPALRSAIRRACGRETAPQHLRQRVAAIIAEAAVAAPASQPAPSRTPLTADRAERSRWSILPLLTPRSLAAAAVILICVGVVAVEVRNEFSRSVAASPPARVAAFPASFALEMVRTHQNCAKLPDHHLVAGGSDFDNLHETLSKDEGVNVFAATLGDDWQFQGAGICNVGDKKAAHLLFAKGDERVSVFSMPWSDYDGAVSNYAETVDHHAMAGFVNGGALYCVVGSKTAGGDLPMSEVKPLLAKVRTTLGCPPGSGACDMPKQAIASR